MVLAWDDAQINAFCSEIASFIIHRPRDKGYPVARRVAYIYWLNCLKVILCISA